MRWIGVLFFTVSILTRISAQQLPENVRPQLNTAQKLILATDYIAAKNVLDNYIKSNNTDKYGYYLRGMVYMRSQDLSAALLDLNKSLSIDKKFDAAYNLIGYCYFISEDYEIAIKYYDKAIDINDSISEYFTNRGHAYSYLHDYIDAMKDLNKAIVLDSTNYLAYNNRGYAIYYNQNIEQPSKLDLENAEKDFDICIKLQPGFRLAYRNRGVVRYYLKSYDLAYKDLKLATQWDDEDDVALHALGRTLQALGQHAQAIEYFKKCIALKNYIALFYVDKSESELKLKNYAAASTDLNTAINLSPLLKGQVYFLHSRIAGAQDDKTAMLEYIKSAYKAKFFNTNNIYKLLTDEYLSKYKEDKDYRKLIDEIRF
jgi:tetratricopeptide (TPR) repeat protein